MIFTCSAQYHLTNSQIHADIKGVNTPEDPNTGKESLKNDHVKTWDSIDANFIEKKTSIGYQPISCSFKCDSGCMSCT